MSIIFDEVAHTYTDDKTGEMSPSVNQLVDAVWGSGVEHIPYHILKAAADRGTERHKDIHNVLTTGKGGKYTETAAFLEFAQLENLPIFNPETLSEYIVYVPGMFAGTVDLFCERDLFDYKTSRHTPTQEMLGHWQKTMSCYYYALKKMGLKPKSITILHLSGEECTPYVLDYLGDQFVEDTVKAYKEGRKLAPEKPVAQTELQTVDQNTLMHLGEVLREIATLEKEIEPIREQIKVEMEKRGILALEVGGVRITYIGPTRRETLDTKRFKAENEALYNQYKKTTEVKSSVRIKTND